MKCATIFPVALGLLLSACSLDAFLNDGSTSLRSGPGNDPAFRLTVADGQVVREPVSNDISGTYSVHSGFISLQMGDVLVIDGVMPDPGRGATIAVEYSQHDLESNNEPGGYLYTILYRPDSPVKLSFFTTTLARYAYLRAGVSYGTHSEQNDIQPRLSWTDASGSFEGNGERVPGESEPQWAAVTINRDGFVRFYLQGLGFSENTIYFDEYTRRFGALSILPVIGSIDEWMDFHTTGALGTETSMDPINRPLTQADPERPGRFEVRTVMVFDYALTPEQLLALVQL